MKILLIGDIHCNLRTLRMLVEEGIPGQVDLIAVNGDVECDSEIVETIIGLEKPTFYVPGNMDDAALSKIFKDAGLNIDGELRSMGNDWVIGGIGGISLFSSINNFRLKAEKIELRRKKLAILSHHPPRTNKTDLAFGVIHAGVAELNEVIRDFKPLLFMHGHIHEAMGHEYLGETLVVNPGPLYKGYYAIINTEELEVEHKRLKL